MHSLKVHARPLPLPSCPCSSIPLLPLTPPHDWLLDGAALMQRCLAVQSWLMAAVGVALPLAVLGAREAAGRCSLYARRLRQAQQQRGGQQEQAAADLERLRARETVLPQPWHWCNYLVCLHALWLTITVLQQFNLL